MEIRAQVHEVSKGGEDFICSLYANWQILQLVTSRGRKRLSVMLIPC